MQYLIAHMLEGEAGDYVRSLADLIAKDRKLEAPSVRIDPHLTLKAPFEVRGNTPEGTPHSIAEIEGMLDAFSSKEQGLPFALGGFGEFDRKVVYMHVEAPKQTHMLLRRLQDRLRSVSWMQFKRTEFPLTLHATLAYPKTREQCREILSGLKKERATFEGAIDSLALLQNDGDRWDIRSTYRLSG